LFLTLHCLQRHVVYAGKTTLVKHILSNTIGMKVLVIENEVGEQGIDHDLLLQYAGKEEIILLKNGCVCCTVRSDLIKTFRSIFAKQDVLAALDWVVIETTGLADPAPVIQSLLVDEECKKYLRLDSVLTVVDSKHITLHLPLPGALSGPAADSAAAGTGAGAAGSNASEAALQIAFADRILLNKVDLVSATELGQVKDLVLSVNPGADIITCRHAEVGLREILNIRTFDPSEFTKSMTTRGGDDSSKAPTVTSSSGYSFLPKNSSGEIDILRKATRRGAGAGAGAMAGVTVTPARLGASHAAGAGGRDVVCTISLTLPEAEPLDLTKLNV
jgi:G3E family GTPase